MAVPTVWRAPLPSSDAAANAFDATDLTTWWTRFNDPTLTRLIDTALAESPNLLTVRSRVEVARAQLAVSRASLLPSVNASVSGSGNETRHRDTDTTTRGESYSANLGASWEIDLFGTNRLATTAANADWQQSVASYHGAQVSLTAEVASAYLNLRTAETRLDLNRQTLVSREASMALSQARFDAGLDDTLALNQARTSVAQVRASIPSLEQNVSVYRNQLTTLCGIAPGSLDDLLGSSPMIPAAPASLAVGIPADTLRQRPDIAAATHAVEAASLRLTAAQRQRLPSLNLTGSLNGSGKQADAIFDPATIAANLAASLTAPLFDAGRISQSIRIQDEQTTQALLAYRSTVVSALAEVENALVALDRNTVRRAALEDALATARVTRELAQLRYDAGQIDYLQVLDAERTLLGLEESTLAATADQSLTQVQLYRALGGGWTPLINGDA